MQVQPINKYNTVSSKAIFYPAKPAPVNMAIVRADIRDAIENNSYIKELAENFNVIAEFSSSPREKNLYHLILDIFDKETKQRKWFLMYSSRICGKHTNLKDTEFIKHIEMPSVEEKTTYQGNFVQRLFKTNPQKIYTIKTQTDYYNMNYITGNSVFPIKGITPEIQADLNNAESKLRKMNEDFMQQI